MFENFLYYLAAVLAGVALPVQVGINKGLQEILERPLLVTFVSFAVGTLTCLLAALLGGITPPPLDKIRTAPYWLWLGGMIGAYLVWSTLTAAPRLGGAVMLGFVVAGQLLTSLILDHFGLLGFPERPADRYRLLGVGLVIAGVVILALKDPAANQ